MCFLWFSYERHYRSLLDHMIKNDLALKGNLDGAELLIFSSNQLPESSQRKNLFNSLLFQFSGQVSNMSLKFCWIVLPSWSFVNDVRTYLEVGFLFVIIKACRSVL